ncbi:hypothetical protein Ahia01_000373800 [Argonauta hians]
MEESVAQFDKTQLKDTLSLYSVENHKDELLSILLAEDETQHFSVVIDTLTLFERDMAVCEVLLYKPVQLLQVFDESLTVAQETLLSTHPTHTHMTVKRNVHARLARLPVCPELTRTVLPKNADVGSFLSVTGTVIQTSAIKVLEFEREFMCSKCHQVFTFQAKIEHYYNFKSLKCQNDSCRSMKLVSVADTGAAPLKCKDYQEIKVQEQIQHLQLGTIPRSMWVVVEDDLVDTCKAGDDVTICGIVLHRWSPLSVDSVCDIDMFIKANHILVTNEKKNSIVISKEMKEEFVSFWRKYQDCPLTGRNHILTSFCPQVYGLYVVKLAVILVLIGGVKREDDIGTAVRGEMHLLLVGDPGTGKSQFLKYAAKLMPRSVLTTGIGSTTAGLTVAAVKDGSNWMLEAGALVLADGGVCCIDEFNSIQESDKASIHEAMEQQCLSVAKAGMICKLNTRTTIIGATNPKGHYDPDQSICVNVALASPLLSRFDLVMVLLDNRNEEWDQVLSSYILAGSDITGKLTETSNRLWNIEKIQSYLSLIKVINPELSENASRVLQAYYRAQRGADDRNAARTTMRLLQSIIRLSQAHARLMLRDVVTVQDAIVAVVLMESTMEGAALLGGVNALHAAFPDDPEEEHETQAKMVLKLLNIEELMEHLTEVGAGSYLLRDTNTSLSCSTGLPPSDLPAGSVGGEDEGEVTGFSSGHSHVFVDNSLRRRSNAS